MHDFARSPAEVRHSNRFAEVHDSSTGIDTEKPGDDAPEGTPGTGESVCPMCGGTGRIAGGPCAECDGTGKVNVGIGGG